MFISDNLFIAITSFCELALSYFFVSIKLRHCLLNFNHQFLIFRPMSAVDPYFSGCMFVLWLYILQVVNDGPDIRYDPLGI